MEVLGLGQVEVLVLVEVVVAEDLVLVHQLVVQHHQHHTNQLLVQQLLVQQHNRCVQHAEDEVAEVLVEHH